MINLSTMKKVDIVLIIVEYICHYSLLIRNFNQIKINIETIDLDNNSIIKMV